MCKIKTNKINTHRLFIILKELPGLFQVTYFLNTLSLQVAFQKLLKHTSVISFVSLQNVDSCLTGQEHWAEKKKGKYSHTVY